MARWRVFNEIYRVSERARRASEDDVRQLEAATRCDFPGGYREFVTMFGQGMLTTWTTVYCPWQIQNEFRQFQDGLREYFFWDAGIDVLSRDRVQESICLGHTMQGDYLIFHPGDRHRLFVLPRQEETIFFVGRDLPEALQWLFSSGKLTRPVELMAFCPDGGRAMFGFSTQGKSPTLHEVRETLLALNIHDRVIDHCQDMDEFEFELFVQEFGGSLRMLAALDAEPPYSMLCEAGSNRFLVDGVPDTAIGRRPLLIVNHDEGKRTPKLKLIIDALKRFGYEASDSVPRTPTDPQ